MSAMTTSTRQLSTFVLDGALFGVDVRRVREVIRHQEMTRVPLAPPTVRGLINLRGQIVTAIDLRRCLEMPPQPDDARPMNVVVQTEDGAVSLLVDEIGDVLDLDADGFTPPPETLHGAARELVTSVYMLRDRLLLELDTDKIVAPIDDDRTAATPRT